MDEWVDGCLNRMDDTFTQMPNRRPWQKLASLNGCDPDLNYFGDGCGWLLLSIRTKGLLKQHRDSYNRRANNNRLRTYTHTHHRQPAESRQSRCETSRCRFYFVGIVFCYIPSMCVLVYGMAVIVRILFLASGVFFPLQS